MAPGTNIPAASRRKQGVSVANGSGRPHGPTGRTILQAIHPGNDARSEGKFPLKSFILILPPLVATCIMVYYAAIIAGIHKSPLMATFRRYGEERRVYPLSRFLEVVAVWCAVLGIRAWALVPQSGVLDMTFAPLVFLVMGGMALGMDVVIRRRPTWREALPPWYYELLRTSSRQERRFIGYAWLRIPRRMRWRLSGDQAAFRSWADTVRLTVLYGPPDPNSPWDTHI